MEKIRYKGPFGHQIMPNLEGKGVVLPRGKVVEVENEEYARKLKTERPSQFDSGEDEESGDPLAPGGE